MSVLRAWLLLLLTVGCTVTLPPLAEGPRTVPAQSRWSATVDAVLPTDLVRTPEGLSVLDGHAGRLLPVSLTGQVGAARVAEGLRGAVRISPAADGGFWVAAPEAGEVRRLGEDLTVRQTLAVPGAVAVLELPGALVVGLRSGGLVWLAPSGDLIRAVSTDVDGVAIGSVAQVVRAADGGVLAVDTLGHRVHHLTAEGVPDTFMGDFGLWIGALSKPKGVAVGPGGTLLVADSALSALQVFELDGSALGALAIDGAIFAPGHPMAVLADGSDLRVLDAEGTLHALSLTEDAVKGARDVAELRHLRHPLVEPDAIQRAAGEARLCLQCHDGVVNDDRAVWDPALGHHPVGVVPDRAVPAAFPVDADGALRCGTCHSPHGTSELASVRAIDDPEQRAALVRHRSTQGDLFTRLSREDSALCVGCHDDAAHDAVVEGVGLAGGAHPTGQALAKALAARGGGRGPAGLPEGIDGGCLTCHTPHAAPQASLLRDSADGAACLACHPDAAGRTSHPLHGDAPAPRAAAELPLGAHGGPTCLTCHALVDGTSAALIRAPADGGDLCGACHTARGPAAAPPPTSAHSRTARGCQSCHDVHQAHRADALLARSGPPADPQSCGTCHASIGGAGHPVGVAHADGTLSCSTCHEAHSPRPARAECGSCHAEPLAAASRGGHGGLDCQACHAPHRQPPRRAVGGADPSQARCLACHGPGGSATVLATWTHPTPVFEGDGPRWEPLRGLTLVDATGTPVAAEAAGSLSCVSCHAVHGPPATAPGRSLLTPGWEPACASCHGDRARPLYQWFHDPDRRGRTP